MQLSNPAIPELMVKQVHYRQQTQEPNSTKRQHKVETEIGSEKYRPELHKQSAGKEELHCCCCYFELNSQAVTEQSKNELLGLPASTQNIKCQTEYHTRTTNK